MSALGQKQTLERLRLMSALPPKADIGTQSWNVRFVPKADIVELFDDFVGDREQLSWDIDAKRSRRLQIDDKLKFVRL